MYTAAIEDLERRRAELDAAIQVLRRLDRGLPAAASTSVQEQAAKRSGNEAYPKQMKARAREIRKADPDLSNLEIAEQLGDEFGVDPPGQSAVHSWTVYRAKKRRHSGQRYPDAMKDRARELAGTMSNVEIARTLAEEFDSEQPTGWTVAIWIKAGKSEARTKPAADLPPKKEGLSQEAATNPTRANTLLAEKRLIDPEAFMVEKDGVFVVNWDPEAVKE